jgi:uncharacterized oligopeptide transporter (OPT) family protein
MPPIFKVALGIEQIWMMIELSLRINQVNKASEKKFSADEEERQDDALTKRIKCYRVATIVLNVCLILFVIVICIIHAGEEDVTFDSEAYFFAAMFGFLFLGLMITISCLARSLLT